MIELLGLRLELLELLSQLGMLLEEIRDSRFHLLHFLDEDLLKAFLGLPDLWSCRSLLPQRSELLLDLLEALDLPLEFRTGLSALLQFRAALDFLEEFLALRDHRFRVGRRLRDRAIHGFLELLLFGLHLRILHGLLLGGLNFSFDLLELLTDLHEFLADLLLSGAGLLLLRGGSGVRLDHLLRGGAGEACAQSKSRTGGHGKQAGQGAGSGCGSVQ